MHSLLAWGLSQGANALNIIAGILVAHTASPYDFGRFATLSASIAIMTAVLNPMINEIAQRIAPLRGISLQSLTTRTLFAATLCCAIAIAACTSIVSSPFEGLIIYLLIPISLIGYSWATGILYGLHHMVTFGGLACMAGLIRIATLSVLMYLGATFIGITVSYLASFLIMTVASFFLLKEVLHSGSNTEWTTNWPLLCGFLLLALPFSIDQPIVQGRFSETSADYAALMTYARSVMLLASPALTLVYSASLQPNQTHRKQHPKWRIPAFIIAAILALSLAFTLWLVYPLLFPLLLGSKYVHVTPHLALALSGMALYVLSYFLIQRMLVSCKWWLCALLAIPPLVQASLLSWQTTPTLFHLTLISVAIFILQFVIAIAAYYLSSKGAHQK